MTGLPDRLQINAWPGSDDNSSKLDSAFKQKLLKGGLALRDLTALGPTPIDDRNWADDRVGWGLVLPDDDGLDHAARANAEDAPEALRELLAHRKGVVLRYRADRSPGTIRRYYADGTPPQDPLIASQTLGTGKGGLPRYLLICASPAQIPWSFQFELQQSRFAGRIDLEEEALDRYVNALLSDWKGSAAQRDRSLVWAVDFGADDNTRLMRNAIAAPFHNRFDADEEFKPGARFIDGTREPATNAALIKALADDRPRLVATTSHGMTGPLGDVPAMRASLGQLVDSDHASLAAAALLEAWQPDGAIWYAQACCSAGSQARTAFDGLVPEGSAVDQLLKGVALCGETTAPFPRALLSAEKPLRAFVGHVEPTFDWSVRYPQTGQYLTQPLLDAFYQRLFTGEPIGMALEGCRRLASGLMHPAFASEKGRLGQNEDVAGDILALRLIANDWKALVLLGDPACTIG
jgi:hypothetical protein